MSPSKKRKLVSSDAAAAGPSSFKGKGKAPVSEPNAAASESFSSEDEDEDDDDAVSLGDAEDDLEGLVGEVLNGEIAQTLVDEQGISHSAVEVLRNGFHPELVEDDRTADQCEDGAALAEAGDAEEVARWLIAPVSLETFMKHTWERKPLYVSRNNNKQYYDGLLSKKNIEDWLVQKQMKYGINVDVTTYKNGVRDTHNVNDDGSGGADPISGETGTADSATIWRRFDTEKASLRVLHPQRWRDPLWKMLSSLETFWRCSTGCNVYLTPPDSQGFAPHFDDIDAFVLQLEGKKLWKVYAPRSEREMLPRYSSANFSRGEIGEPVLEVVLEPGDLLYMPRGTVHQAMCVEKTHSLHVTLSTNQFNTWADVLELAFPEALRRAVEEVPALRRCPPPDFLDNLGVAAQGGDEGEGDEGAADDQTSRRDQLLGVLNELASAVMRRLPFDAAADQLGARLMKQRLPPPPSHLSSSKTSTGVTASNGVTNTSVVRLMQENGARIVIEDETLAVYHSFENGRLYHMEGGDDEDGGDDKEDDDELGVLFFDQACGPAIEILLFSEDAIDTGVEIGDLPLWPEDVKLETVRRLVGAGILAVVR